MALFVAHIILTFVLGAPREYLDPLTVLVVVSPIAFVACIVLGCVDPEPIGFVVHPAAIVDVPTGMVKFAPSTGLIILPGTIVCPRIGPGHSTPTVPHASFPLTRIGGTSLVDVGCYPELLVYFVLFA